MTSALYLSQLPSVPCAAQLRDMDTNYVVHPGCWQGCWPKAAIPEPMQQFMQVNGINTCNCVMHHFNRQLVSPGLCLLALGYCTGGVWYGPLLSYALPYVGPRPGCSRSGRFLDAEESFGASPGTSRQASCNCH